MGKDSDKKPRMGLTERDLIFLERLAQFGFLTIKHVQNHLWKTSYNATTRRLKRICDEGYIRMIRRTDFEGTRCYIPVFKNLEPLYRPDDPILQWVQVAEKYRPWFRSNTEHEDLVRVWALKASEYLPEYEIYPDYHFFEDLPGTEHNKVKHPDLQILGWGSEHSKIQIEIELTMKSKERYQQVFANTYLGHTSGPVLYLTPEAKMKWKLQMLRDDSVSLFRRHHEQKARVVIKEFSEMDTKEKFLGAIEECFASFPPSLHPENEGPHTPHQRSW